MYFDFFLLWLIDDFLVCQIVVSLALICSFSKMRGYLKLGDSKGDDIPEDTIKAVADTLRTSSALKISDDGEFHDIIKFLLGLDIVNNCFN